MGILDGLNFTKPPDAILPIGKNLNIKNYVYLDSDPKEFSLYGNVIDFISKEFTKSIIYISENTPSREHLDYLLNVKPNSAQTANQLLYEFAFGLLTNGAISYSIVNPASAKQVKSISIYGAEVTGARLFEYKQLKLKIPKDLLEKYENLLMTVSTQHSTGAIELNSRIAGAVELDDDTSKKMSDRLKVMASQIKQFGLFFTQSNESTKQHQSITQPDGTALKDLRTLIYEHLHLSSNVLSGDYNEAEYKAFYLTYLRPLANALEEFLNTQLLDETAYRAGGNVSVIYDLLQTASLETFTTFMQQGIYTGTIQVDDLRKVIGKAPYPDELGQVIFTNKNAVSINNKDVNDAILGNTNTDDSSNQTEEDNN